MREEGKIEINYYASSFTSILLLLVKFLFSLFSGIIRRNGGNSSRAFSRIEKSSCVKARKTLCETIAHSTSKRQYRREKRKMKVKQLMMILCQNLFIFMLIHKLNLRYIAFAKKKVFFYQQNFLNFRSLLFSYRVNVSGQNIKHQQDIQIYY